MKATILVLALCSLSACAYTPPVNPVSAERAKAFEEYEAWCLDDLLVQQWPQEEHNREIHRYFVSECVEFLADGGASGALWDLSKPPAEQQPATQADIQRIERKIRRERWE